MLTIDPKKIKVSQLHGYLLGSVGPRPIALASTIDEKGNPNLAPFSFFNVFSANPPIAIFSPARRGRDNTTKHTYENLKKTKEVVINVVTHEMVEQTSLASSEYPQGINEFEKAGFTAIDGQIVGPKRVGESPVQLECSVQDIVELGAEGGAGNLMICKVLLMHIDPSILDENQRIDPHKIDLVGRMGGNWYCRTSGSNLFEVEKPGRVLGIGIDAIPEDIKKSHILSGNDLGVLGGVEKLPNETDVNEHKLTELAELFIQNEDDPQALEDQLHEKAKALIKEGKTIEAWKTLLALNN